MDLTRTGRRRSLILLSVLTACCATAVGCRTQTGGDHEAQRPHVLILSIDTLRPDYLSFENYDRPTSPYLDQLIKSGVYFERAITPVPRTTPALASLLTGQYPHNTGVRTLVDALPEDATTLPLLASRAGYRTLAVVSNHILTPERRLDIGFDTYDAGNDTRNAAATTAKLLELATEHREERLFLWAHYIDPHVPYWPSKERAREFDPGYQGRYADYFGTQQGGIGGAAYPPDYPKPVFVFRNPLSDAVNAHVRRLYAADIRMTDDAVRDLVEGLQKGIGGDWMIVFTSDHGESLGEHDYFYDHGDYVYNATLRVPLAFVLPNAGENERGRRVATWVSLVDVFPTIAAYLELPTVDAHGEPLVGDGRSLLPGIRGESLSPRPVFAESGRSYFPAYVPKRRSNDTAGKFRAMIDGRWKLIMTPGEEPANRYELYDLDTDPGETRNLFNSQDSQHSAMTGTLAAWMSRAPSRPAAAANGLSDDDANRLRSLGYID